MTGLTTFTAFDRLVASIKESISAAQLRHVTSPLLQPWSGAVTLVTATGWISATVALLSDSSYFVVVGTIAALLMGISMSLVLFDVYQSRREKVKVVEGVLDMILEVSSGSRSTSSLHQSAPDISGRGGRGPHLGLYLNENYPNTSSVSVVKVYRNGKIVSVGRTLLVQGDYILLSPGESAPTQCRSLDGVIKLETGDVFFGKVDETTPVGSKHCVVDTPRLPVLFVVSETDYGAKIKSFLAHQPLKSKVISETECLIKILNFIILPISLVLSGISAAIQAVYLPTGTELYSSLAAALPLLPVMYPVFYVVSRYFCTAYIIITSRTPPPINHTPSDIIKTPDDLSFMSGRSPRSLLGVISLTLRLILGKEHRYLPRNSNLFDTLSSVTVLCTVNKEGILSHPSPNVERIMLLDPVGGTLGSPPPGTTNTNLAGVAEEPEEEEVKNKAGLVSSLPEARSCYSVAESHLETTTPYTDKVYSDASLVDSYPSKKSEGMEVKEEGSGGGEVLAGSLPNLHKAFKVDSIPVNRSLNASLVVDPTCSIPEVLPAVKPKSKVARLNLSKSKNKDLKEFTSVVEVEEGTMTEAKQKKKKKLFWKKIQRNRLHRYHAIPVTAEEDHDDPPPEVLEGVETTFDPGSLLINHPPSLKDEFIVVVNVSLCKQSPLGISFDRSTKDINDLKESLKPVGLTVLLNNMCRLHDSDCSVTHHLQFVSIKQYCGLTFRLPLPTDYCNCTIGREIGFTLAALDQYERVCNLVTYIPQRSEKGERTQRNPADSMSPLTCVFSTLVRDKGSSDRHVFSYGTGPLMMKCCSTYWDGNAVRPLSDKFKSKVLEFYNQNRLTSHCFVLGYRPLLDHEAHPSQNVFLSLPLGSDFLDMKAAAPFDEAEHFLKLQVGQTFIGVVCAQFQPKPDIVHLVEVVVGANIRFVHFSYDNELRSRAFGTKLGLETGWNCHISLADDDYDKFSVDSMSENESQTFFYYTYNARLPQGIKNIRPHLANVDNVPLLVPLFTSCTSPAITEMITIMQENQEVVCGLGSTLQYDNFDIFLSADCSIGVIPLLPQQCMAAGIKDIVLPWSADQDYFSLPRPCNLNITTNSLHLCSILDTLPCSLILSRSQNIELEPIIHAARVMLVSFRQMSYIGLTMYMIVSLYCLIHQVLMLPAPLSLGYTLFTCAFTIPILSLTPYTLRSSRNIMQLHTGKRGPIFSDFRRHLQYFILRSVFLLLVSPVNTIISLKLLCEGDRGQNTTCSWFVAQEGDMRFSRTAIEVTQQGNAVILALTLSIYAFVLSNRTARFNLKFLRRHVTLLTLVPPFITVLFSVTVVIGNLAALRWPPYPMFVVGVTTPMITGAAAILTKHWDGKYFKRYQRRQKLQFNTRLGMCSPF